MATLLITAIPEASAELTRLLQPHHRLIYANSVGHALEVAKHDRPDAIICGLLFDDSRMFDFLRECKADPELADIPFICVRVLAGSLPRAVLDSLDVAARALGGCMFIDVFSISERGEEEQVIMLVNHCLPEHLRSPATSAPRHEKTDGLNS